MLASPMSFISVLCSYHDFKPFKSNQKIQELITTDPEEKKQGKNDNSVSAIHTAIRPNSIIRPPPTRMSGNRDLACDSEQCKTLPQIPPTGLGSAHQKTSSQHQSKHQQASQSAAQSCPG